MGLRRKFNSKRTFFSITCNNISTVINLYENQSNLNHQIMEHHLPKTPEYVNKVHVLNQAIFYCYNASSQRIPVGMIYDFTFKDDQTLIFHVNYFPVTEMSWNSFAAELHFYKKNTPGSCVLHGVAVLDDLSSGVVSFTISSAVYGNEIAPKQEKSLLSNLFKPYLNFYRKSSELLLHPFKRKTTTGVFQ